MANARPAKVIAGAPQSMHAGRINTGAYNLGLIYMNARYYLPEVGRFISPDSIVPEPGNPQSFNRYSYSYNNPVNYIDPSGHCIFGVDTAVCIAVGLGILKAVDYGWTAYDMWQAGRTLADPSASSDAKMNASLTVSLALLFEAIEPDDILPVGLPADDIARRALVESAQKAYADGGIEAVEAVIRNQLGDNADVVLNSVRDALCCSGQQHHIFSNKIMRALEGHETLGGIFQREDAIVQALDLSSHKGYPKWHRAYDNEVVRWLRSNKAATAEEFLDFLGGLYSTPEMQRRFPEAWEILRRLQP